MKLADFDFDLPHELIAQHPLTERSASRLMSINRNTGSIVHDQFKNLTNYLRPGDLLIFNDTKVIAARLFAVKETSGKVEILVERILGNKKILAQVRASKTPKVGSKLFIDDEKSAVVLEVAARQGEFFELNLIAGFDVYSVLEKYGKIPLPPYIDRSATLDDQDRYQTIFAKFQGAVAAPTAGLHFDQPLLDQIASMGVKTAFVTLHIGAGTFQPVRVKEIEQHQMHTEYATISTETCEQINKTKAAGGRVIAVGTTSVRVLETAARFGEVKPFMGDTAIFIYPGYKFRCIDALITNFHLPQSTLLMLVCAFAGREQILAAYQTAVRLQYRFFSYGDAMFIW